MENERITVEDPSIHMVASSSNSISDLISGFILNHEILSRKCIQRNWLRKIGGDAFVSSDCW